MADIRFIDLPELDPIVDGDNTILAVSEDPHAPGSSKYINLTTLLNYYLPLISFPEDFPALYSNGMYLNWLTNSQVQILPGAMRSDPDDYNLISASPLAVDLTVSGVGGLDSGVEAINTWYAAHVIGDTTGVNPVAAICSLSSTTPVLPPGYDTSGFRGWFRNNGSSDIIQFVDFSSGRRVHQRYINTSRNATQIIASSGPTTFTLASAAAFVPPSSRYAEFFINFNDANSRGHEYAFRIPGEAVADLDYMSLTRLGANNGSIETRNFVTLSSTQTFEYRVFDNGAGTPSFNQISVYGYEYTI